MEARDKEIGSEVEGIRGLENDACVEANFIGSNEAISQVDNERLGKMLSHPYEEIAS